MSSKRPSTDGCTEWSCMYHGGENQFKAGHEDGCPIRSYDGHVMNAIDGFWAGPRCTCPWNTSKGDTDGNRTDV